ncbi:MAG: hypothetical protein DRJ67_11670 [Thermoprotei archaeon]|nr:MAG: hypothetical protein DRJ67_11670 [Thermoprotei archaeon]
MRYLRYADYVPPNFWEQPQAILVEAGNGFGKTHSAVELAASLQVLQELDRIIILEYSQRGCRNVVRMLRARDAFAIRHIGIEKFCKRRKELRRVAQLGLTPTAYCSFCPYFRGKARLAYSHLRAAIEDEGRKIIEPELVREPLSGEVICCTHPILRALVLNPAPRGLGNLRLPATPIIVCPGQLFLNHAAIGRWHTFSKRQRKVRRTLLITDEADSLFYHSLQTVVPQLDFTEDDRELLAEFSPRRRDLSQILDCYRRLYEVLRKSVGAKDESLSDVVSCIRTLLEEAEPLLRSIARRRREMVKYIIENRVRTRVFRAVEVLEELGHIDNLNYALRTAELDEQSGRITLYDYDYGVRLLLDVEFPWKYLWKINLSATFPTVKVVESRFLSPHTKRIILQIRRRSLKHENVWTTTIGIFEATAGRVNRNAEIRYSTHRLIQAVKRLAEAYEQSFGDKPGGVAVWCGNSKQLKAIAEALQRVGVRAGVKGGHLMLRIAGLPVLLSYCGSKIARGIDLNQFDISLVVGPLLRPPRRWGFLDVLDFARAVAEAVQSAMRIVRAPRPERPKLIAIEKTMATAYYAHFFPEWFKAYFRERYLELDAEEPQEKP